VEQKREIAAASLEPGVSPLTVARRNGISSGQLYTWRRQLLEGQRGGSRQPVAKFARVAVLAEPPAQPASASPVSPSGVGATSAPSAISRPCGTIEITLPGGVIVRVDRQVDSGALRRVLAALASR
jgi:transposase